MTIETYCETTGPMGQHTVCYYMICWLNTTIILVKPQSKRSTEIQVNVRIFGPVAWPLEMAASRLDREWPGKILNLWIYEFKCLKFILFNLEVKYHDPIKAEMSIQSMINQQHLSHVIVKLINKLWWTFFTNFYYLRKYEYTISWSFSSYTVHQDTVMHTFGIACILEVVEVVLEISFGTAHYFVYEQYHWVFYLVIGEEVPIKRAPCPPACVYFTTLLSFHSTWKTAKIYQLIIAAAGQPVISTSRGSEWAICVKTGFTD